MNLPMPDMNAIQSWLSAIGLIVTTITTLYIVVMQRVNAARLSRRMDEAAALLAQNDKKLEVKTDAQSAKLDEIHTQTVNGKSKLAAVPGDPDTVPPIPKG